MTEFSGPFDVDPPDTDDGYEGMYQDQWSRMARVWAEDAVMGDQGGPALQVYVSGAQIGVRVGEAEIRGYWYRNTAPILWTPAPNAAGQPRTDLVVLRLDRTAKKVEVKVVAGTAGSGEPALTQSDADDGVWEIALGGYVIPAGDTLPAGQFDKRMFQGLRVWRPSSQEVLPTSGVPLWQPAVLPDGRHVRWNGTTWISDADAVSVETLPVQWVKNAIHGTATLNCLRLNGRVIVTGTIVSRITDTSAFRIYLTGLPAPASGANVLNTVAWFRGVPCALFWSEGIVFLCFDGTTTAQTQPIYATDVLTLNFAYAHA